MQAPQKGAKQTSKWGNFFQQAVAGVESRLDTILAENEDQAKPIVAKPATSTSQPAPQDGMKAVPSIAQSNAKSPRSSIDQQPSRNLSLRGKKALSQPTADTIGSEALNESQNVDLVDNGAARSEDGTVSPSAHRRSAEATGDETKSSDDSASDKPEDLNNGSEADRELQERYEQLRSDYEAAELRRQEEVHGHMERIDALQAKLQYLSRQAADTAKEDASALSSGSLEKKLAEKDEQIALLMDEGQNLSKVELKQSTAIKKLRLKATEDERNLRDAQSALERSQNESQGFRDKLKSLQSSEKLLNERQKTIIKLEKDFEQLRSDNMAQRKLVAQLQAQAADSQSKFSENERKENLDKLQKQLRLVSDLRDDLSNAKIEKELAEDRLRMEIKQVKESAQKDKEQFKALESELRGEQAVLESKLEAFRARVEEASSGVTGDAQAKLLRQVETLQAQYAVANENWQGIESSMSARVTALEKERDELTKRESDLRRKAREINSRSKRVQDDLDSLTESSEVMKQELSDTRESLQKALKRAEQAEGALAQARSDLGEERKSFDAKLQQRLEEEKMRFREEGLQTPTSYQNGRTRSPAPFSRKSSGFELHGMGRRAGGRSPSIEPTNSAWHERPSSRRASTQPFPKSPDLAMLQRIDSTPPMSSHKRGSLTNETPSIAIPDEDYFEGVTSPNSPHRTVEDVISASTAGAGPSVQLVERMSAAVRRLESEKAASKEELTRLSSQRDAAREEIVGLLREAEEKRDLDTRLKKLEGEKEKLDARYQTTLEMLGEKSEMVEELQADVADMKKIYRELLDSTMK